MATDESILVKQVRNRPLGDTRFLIDGSTGRGAIVDQEFGELLSAGQVSVAIAALASGPDANSHGGRARHIKLVQQHLLNLLEVRNTLSDDIDGLLNVRVHRAIPFPRKASFAHIGVIGEFILRRAACELQLL
jgi:hypothetical protein